MGNPLPSFAAAEGGRGVLCLAEKGEGGVQEPGVGVPGGAEGQGHGVVVGGDSHYGPDVGNVGRDEVQLRITVTPLREVGELECLQVGEAGARADMNS